MLRGDPPGILGGVHPGNLAQSQAIAFLLAFLCADKQHIILMKMAWYRLENLLKDF